MSGALVMMMISDLLIDNAECRRYKIQFDDGTWAIGTVNKATKAFDLEGKKNTMFSLQKIQELVVKSLSVESVPTHFVYGVG